MQMKRFFYFNAPPIAASSFWRQRSTNFLRAYEVRIDPNGFVVRRFVFFIRTSLETKDIAESGTRRPTRDRSTTFNCPNKKFSWTLWYQNFLQLPNKFRLKNLELLLIAGVTPYNIPIRKQLFDYHACRKFLLNEYLK